MAAVGREKLDAIFVKMSDLALEGNVAAAKFCTSYMIGKPLPSKDPDRVDVEEWQLMKEEAPMLKEVKEHGPILDPHLPLEVARTYRYAATKDRAGMMAAMFSLPPKEQTRLFELGAASPYEVCNLLRDKARHPERSHPNKPPSANGKRKRR